MYIHYAVNNNDLLIKPTFYWVDAKETAEICIHSLYGIFALKRYTEVNCIWLESHENHLNEINTVR